MRLLYDLVQNNSGIGFVQLEPPFSQVPQPPRFLFGPLRSELTEAYFQLIHLHQVGVFVCKDVEVRGPYLILHDGDVVACPQANFHAVHLAQVLPEDFLSQKGVKEVSGDCAMVFGPGYEVFGHWMVDFLPKFYLLQQAGYDLAQISFLLPSDCPAFGRELFDLVGIGHDRIVSFDRRSETVLCERLLLPTTCHNGLLPAKLLTENIKWLRQRIEDHGGPLKAPGGLERVFVSRGRRFARNRTLVNREEIEAMAVAHGFTLVYPEEITLFEQFGLFSECRQVIGEYGSALHNAMFSPAGTVVCGLRGDSVHPGFVQSALSQALDHHTGYIIGTNVSEKWDFAVAPQHFAAALRCIFSGAPLAIERAPRREIAGAAFERYSMQTVTMSMNLSLT